MYLKIAPFNKYVQQDSIGPLNKRIEMSTVFTGLNNKKMYILQI